MSRASCLFALLLIFACGCDSSTRTSSGPVPWVDRPRPRYEIPPPPVVRYPTTAPACRPSQVRVRQGRNGVATGTLFEWLIFENVSTRPCLLRGYPQVTADTPTGRRVLHPRRGAYPEPLVPADLGPRRHVLLAFATSDCGCRCERPHPVRYRNLVFTLPRGGNVSAPGVSLVVDCFLAMNSFGLPERYVDRARAGTAGTLRARVHAPSVVHSGVTILYTVRLTNPTDVAVVLRPCPSYTDGNGQSFALNCDTVRAISPHGHVDYAMRLRIPQQFTRNGVAKIVWSLNTPYGPHTAAVARVTHG
jgi:hypothetical protein